MRVIPTSQRRASGAVNLLTLFLITLKSPSIYTYLVLPDTEQI